MHFSCICFHSCITKRPDLFLVLECPGRTVVKNFVEVNRLSRAEVAKYVM